MYVRTMLLATVLAAAGTLPATATPDTSGGFNTGDDGLVAMVYEAVTDTGTAGKNGGTDTIEAHCEYHQQTFPNSNDVVVVVEGHAHVAPRGTTRAVSTAVRCRLRNIYTNATIDHQAAIESSNGLWLPPKTESTRVGAWEVCGAVEVMWNTTEKTGDLDDLTCEPVD